MTNFLFCLTHRHSRDGGDAGGGPNHESGELQEVWSHGHYPWTKYWGGQGEGAGYGPGQRIHVHQRVRNSLTTSEMRRTNEKFIIFVPLIFSRNSMQERLTLLSQYVLNLLALPAVVSTTPTSWLVRVRWVLRFLNKFRTSTPPSYPSVAAVSSQDAQSHSKP